MTKTQKRRAKSAIDHKRVERPVKKIKKRNESKIELRGLYENIIKKIKTKKSNRNQLNEVLSKSFDYFQNSEKNIMSLLIGSKILQLLLKYGSNQQREFIIDYCLKNNLAGLTKGRYESFIIEKIFKYAFKCENFGLVKKFIKTNFGKILKTKENFRVVNSYLNYLKPSEHLDMIEKHQLDFQREEFEINEFVEFLENNHVFLAFGLVYYFIYYNFQKINVLNKQKLVTLIVKTLERSLVRNKESFILIVILDKLFAEMNMKFKKEIIRGIFTTKFLFYYKQDCNFIYLLFSFLRKIKDVKVINITILKSLRASFGEFFQNVNLAKFLILLIKKNCEERFKKEKIFSENFLSRENFDLKQIFNDELFLGNLNHLVKALLDSD